MQSELPQARHHKIPCEPGPQEGHKCRTRSGDLRRRAVLRLPRIGESQPLEIHRYLRFDALASSGVWWINASTNLFVVPAQYPAHVALDQFVPPRTGGEGTVYRPKVVISALESKGEQAPDLHMCM